MRTRLLAFAILGGLIVWVLPSSVTSAQAAYVLEWVSPGTFNGALGYLPSDGGDMEDDGQRDLIVMWDHVGDSLAVFDALTHARKWLWSANPGEEIGLVRGFFDVDGDGVREAWFGVGPGGSPRLQAIDWTLPGQHPTPEFLVPANASAFQFTDIDGDGKTELVYSAPDPLSQTHVYIWGDGTTAPSGVPSREILGPDRSGLTLPQNHPNPFTTESMIEFSLAHPSSVTIQVFSVTGRVIRNLLASAQLQRGTHRINWDGRDDKGRAMASGQYFYQVSAGSSRATRRTIILR